MSDVLLTEIEKFLSDTGMGEYRFGLRAARNGRLIERLRAGTTPTGKPVWIRPETVEQIREFMRAERAARRLSRQRKPSVAA